MILCTKVVVYNRSMLEEFPSIHQSFFLFFSLFLGRTLEQMCISGIPPTKTQNFQRVGTWIWSLRPLYSVSVFSAISICYKRSVWGGGSRVICGDGLATRWDADK